tara:strand:+ start:470 stop:772 length:303 start_codon:yes stop_codon:yes gene_type:complete
VKKIYSYILIITLTLPIFLGLVHSIFEDHKVSQEIELNIHANESDCSYCSLYTSIDNNYLDKKELFIDIIHNCELVLTYIDLKLVNNPIGFNLRGPPAKS